MGGTTAVRAATLLADPMLASRFYAWAASLAAAHSEAMDFKASISGPELRTISLMAPIGSIVQSAGDPSSTTLTLISTLDVEVTPALTQAVRAPMGVRFVAGGLRRLQD